MTAGHLSPLCPKFDFAILPSFVSQHLQLATSHTRARAHATTSYVSTVARPTPLSSSYCCFDHQPALAQLKVLFLKVAGCPGHSPTHSLTHTHTHTHAHTRLEQSHLCARTPTLPQCTNHNCMTRQHLSSQPSSPTPPATARSQSPRPSLPPSSRPVALPAHSSFPPSPFFICTPFPCCIWLFLILRILCQVCVCVLCVWLTCAHILNFISSSFECLNCLFSHQSAVATSSSSPVYRYVSCLAWIFLGKSIESELGLLIACCRSYVCVCVCVCVCVHTIQDTHTWRHTTTTWQRL